MPLAWSIKAHTCWCLGGNSKQHKYWSLATNTCMHFKYNSCATIPTSWDTTQCKSLQLQAGKQSNDSNSAARDLFVYTRAQGANTWMGPAHLGQHMIGCGESGVDEPGTHPGPRLQLNAVRNRPCLAVSFSGFHSGRRLICWVQIELSCWKLVCCGQLGLRSSVLYCWQQSSRWTFLTFTLW